MLNTLNFDSNTRGPLRQFFGPGQGRKSLRPLCGLIIGVHADDDINENQIELLRSCINSVSNLQAGALYNKFTRKIKDIIGIDIITTAETEKLIWLRKSCREYNRLTYYHLITSANRQLGGIPVWISASQTMHIQELIALGQWYSVNAPLFRIWPFKISLHATGLIPVELQLLNADHSQLVIFCTSLNVIKTTGKKNVTINVMVPEQLVCIVIQECRFYFTGEFARCSQKELAQIVEMYGGTAFYSVIAKLRYLMTCDMRNTAWIFEMPGDKAENAMNLKGGSPQLVFEED